MVANDEDFKERLLFMFVIIYREFDRKITRVNMIQEIIEFISSTFTNNKYVIQLL